MADPRSTQFQTGYAPPTGAPPGAGTNMSTNLSGPPGVGGRQQTGHPMTNPIQPGGYSGQPPSNVGQYSGGAPHQLPGPPPTGAGQNRMQGPPMQNQMRYPTPVQPGQPTMAGQPGSTMTPGGMSPRTSQPSMMNSQHQPMGADPRQAPGHGGVGPPPLPGQQYQPPKPGMGPPPTSQPMPTGSGPRPPSHQIQTGVGPSPTSQPTQPGMGQPSQQRHPGMGPPPAMHSPRPGIGQPPSSQPLQPPMANAGTSSAAVNGVSYPPSARSSAAPSPIPTGRFDALEGGTPYNPNFVGPNLAPPSGPPSRQTSVGTPTGPPTSLSPAGPFASPKTSPRGGPQPSHPSGMMTGPPTRPQPQPSVRPQMVGSSGPPTGPPTGPPGSQTGPPMGPPGTQTGPPMGPPGTQTGPPMGPPGTQTGPPMGPPGTQTGPPMGPPGSQTGAPMGPPSGPPMGPPSGPPMGPPPSQPMGPPSSQPMGPPSSQPMGPPSSQPMGPPSNLTGPPMQDMQGSRSGGPMAKRAYPQYPNQTGMSGPPPPGGQPGSTVGVPNDTFNQPRPQPVPNAQPYSQPANQYENNLSSSMGKLNIQQGDTRPINLLQNRHVLLSTPVEPPKPNLSPEYRKLVCNPDIFRTTLSSIPQTQQLLNKSKLPLGILIHPFKDLTHLPVIQSSVIVRCRSCRTYINPFVSFVDHRRWKCNLCYRINDLPDEFNFDPVTRTYGEPQRRPEIKSATIEFIAPSEYMLRPPQPATYLFMFDVCFSAVESGYLSVACQVLMEELDKLPGDARTMIGFVTFDSTLHFYNLQEGLSRPSMMVVSDIEDIFLPCPNDLLVNLQESKELIQELLTQLPSMFSGNKETQSALGPALQSALKLMSPIGGRVTVFQSSLPSYGPGALKSREDMSQRTNSKDIPNLGPATDFYKKMSLDCSAQQISVDLFLFANNYIDIASLSCVSKFSGGCVSYYPAFHTVRTPAEVERFENDFRRYITRKIGFEAVMRIRCTKGLSIHTFHGNFFVRSTDLLSLPNINPDAGFAMQMSIEDNLNDSPLACFQAALLYTSSKGERRIRVHTLCLPVTNQLSEVYAGADVQGIVSLLSRMAVDRTLTATIVDARDALVNVCIDSLSQFKSTLSSGQAGVGLMCPNSLRLLPLYTLAMLKCTAFKLSSSVRLDERVFAMDMLKYQPMMYAMLMLHPTLYAVHELTDEGAISHDDQTVPQPAILSLSSEHLFKNGAYLMDKGDALYLYINRDISPNFVQSVLDVPDFQSIPEPMHELPELENPVSDRLRNFVQYLEEKRPFHAPLHVIREDSRLRILFLRHLVEDRSESVMSYYEFLQHIQKEVGK
ncbi:protein transport protein Sec24A-like [Glandiceps talaboti]